MSTPSDLSCTVALFGRIRTTAIPSDVVLIQTAGFSLLGKGAARYIRRTAVPGTTERAAGNGRWLTQDASGAWFALAEPVVTDHMLGVIADATIDSAGGVMTVHGTDDTTTLQAAFDYTLFFNPNGRRLLIPFGLRRITDTLHLGFGDATTSWRVEGDGSYAVEPGARPQAEYRTGIVAGFDDRPAINIAGARRSTLSGIAVIGRNDAWLQQHFDGIQDRAVKANWFGPGLRPPTTDTRYAPYAGVTIDAYAGPRDAHSQYPDAAYPAWRGLKSSYDKGFSSQVVFENVAVSGFEVGVAVQPNAVPVASNGDFIRWVECTLSNNVYGVSVSHADARVVSFARTMIHYCHVAADSVSFGQGNGNFAAGFVDCSFDGCHHVFNVNLAPGLQALAPAISMRNCYGEGMYALGVVATRASAGKRLAGFSAEGSQFNFIARPGEHHPAYVLDGGGRLPMAFERCCFSGLFGPLCFNGPLTAFAACTRVAVQYWPFEATLAGHIAQGHAGFVWAPSARDVSGYPFQHQTFDGYGVTDFLDGEAYDIAPPSPDSVQGAIVPWWANTLLVDRSRVPVARLAPQVLDRSAHRLAQLSQADGIEWRFTAPLAFLDDPAEPDYCVGLGDIVECSTSGFLFYVKEVHFSGAGAGQTMTVTLRQVTGVFTADGRTWTTRHTMSATAGLLTFHNARRCYPGRTKRIVMTVTAGSRALTFAVCGTETPSGAYPPELSPLGNYGSGHHHPYLVSSAHNSHALQDTVFAKARVTAMDVGTGMATADHPARRGGTLDAPMLVRVF